MIRAMTTESARSARLTAVMREGERVKPLELFFDLVFVLVITQCTALMVAGLSWEAVGQGVLVLALLWWAWTGYAWLTSVVDPEEGSVRLALFGAMAALLLAALSLPEAFGENALEFALAYCAVRAGHIALFVLASQEDPGLRHAVSGLAGGTAVGCRPVDRRLVLRSRVAGGDLVARARDRPGRALPRLGRGLAAGSRATSPSATG